MNKQYILGGVAALLFVGAVIGAMQWGAYQQQECSSSWYWIGYNVGVGKEIEP